ncbi:DnaD domain-containing protein [Halobacillus sp. A1]|uniref:DnaD domain-containing protein n=1 Tax=Halobacillus sp. A1 TaxID=2880262 RepID=UPI0020A691B3|nr:DnaD domain-containing protein [Halobacillus sp. A1]MCP3030726.1 DnaD domain-containing protein [Halobacillus sp. A1]
MEGQISIPKTLITGYRSLGIAEKELVTILQLFQFNSEGNTFPTPDEISERTSFSEEECSKILRSLLQKQLLKIEQKDQEQRVGNECYSLEPLWAKLFRAPVTKKQPPEQVDNLFPLFEQEFGRPLSPFEIENINIWLDQEEQEPALIKAALREAVLMGKLNFKYIDRILREWKKKGIQTVDQARQHGKKFRQGQSKNNSDKPRTKRDVSLYYNWLEED